MSLSKKPKTDELFFSNKPHRWRADDPAYCVAPIFDCCFWCGKPKKDAIHEEEQK